MSGPTPTRRALLALAPAVAIAWAARRARAADARRFLYVQPLGDELAGEDSALVKTALEAVIGLSVKVLPRAALPADAWYAPRRRYRADRLLDFLDPRLPADGTRILGLTGVDISTTKGTVFDWGVLGLGRLDGASSVISRFRCAMKSRGAAHARERLAAPARSAGVRPFLSCDQRRSPCTRRDTRWASSTARTGAA